MENFIEKSGKKVRVEVTLTRSWDSITSALLEIDRLLHLAEKIEDQGNLAEKYERYRIKW